MSVYKATYCYPFLNALDIRTAARSYVMQPVQCLSCKVDTSNKNITGYSIRILDANNNVLFPLSKKKIISPIEDLAGFLQEDLGVNSGVNGTYLQIPFFQNKNKDFVKFPTLNAIYYTPKFVCDYVIDTQTSKTGADNLNNWNIDGDYLVYSMNTEENYVTINGKQELLKINDVVLAANLYEGGQKEKNGIWLVSKLASDGSKKVYLSKIAYDLGNTDKVALSRGKYENLIYTYQDGSFTITDDVNEDGLWTALFCDGNSNTATWQKIPGINVRGMTLKWEITLYQGNGTKQIADNSLFNKNIYYMNYDDVDENSCDMTLTSGTILGSTPERIQLCSYNGEYLPNGRESTLVLQTRYMDFMNLYSGELDSSGEPIYNEPSIFSGSRVYVQNYDVTYGHAYPLTNSLDSNIVNNCSHVQFFKHSNSVDSILDSDIVEFGISKNISFIFYSTKVSSDNNYTSYDKNEDKWRQETSATERIIVIEDSQPDWPSSNLVVGNRILLTGQTDKKQNGVYSYYTLTNNNKTYHCIKRAASYTSWAAYIGKVIYCSNGDLGGSNQESLANAGTYNLWNPLSATSDGDSPLLFTNEMPILLFPQQLKGNATYNLYDSINDLNSSSTEAYIDNQPVQLGDFILYKNKKIGVVTKIKDSGYEVSEMTSIQLQTGDLVYILGGQEYGHRVLKVTGSSDKPFATDWTLFTAKILKNTPTKTFISPYINLKERMKIKLINNKKFPFEKTDRNVVYSPWLTIKEYNQTLNYIVHDKLAELTDTDEYCEGIESKNNGTYGLISYTSDYNLNYPWKYQVKSFFQASDENTFYAYSAPYLVLYRDGQPYTNLRTDFYVDFTTLSASFTETQVWENFTTRDEIVGSSKYNQFLVLITDPSEINIIYNRFINLNATYIQHEGISWESYRWVLINSNGDKIQDTGKQYDHDMSVYFYGLSNDSAYDVVYYAILYVEDGLNNLLQYVIKLVISNAQNQQAQNPFKAVFDCATHSVILNYQDYGTVAPSYYIGGEIVQTYEVDSEPNALWDDGISYNSLTDKDWQNYLQITNKGNNQQVIIDYSEGEDLISEGQEYSASVSTAVSKGVGYGYNFISSETSELLSDNRALTLDDNSSKGKFYFDTKIKLSPNYCGEILAINVEKEAGAGTFDPYINTQSDTSANLQGYITFSVELPDNFKQIESGLELNDDRWYLRFNLYKDKGTNSSSLKQCFFGSSTSDYYNFLKKENYLQDDSGNVVSKYYLQEKDYSSENWEFLRFKLKDNKFLWKRQDQNNPSIYFSAYRHWLGNLNCITKKDLAVKTDWNQGCVFNSSEQSKDAPSYWAERRYYLQWLEDEHLEQKWHYGIANDSTVSEYYQDNYLIWCSNGDESTTFWNEQAEHESINTNSIFWEDVSYNSDGKTENIDQLVPHQRHNQSDLDKTSYRITMKIDAVQSIYDSWDYIQLKPTYDGISYIITIQQSTTSKTENLGSIILTPEEIISGN